MWKIKPETAKSYIRELVNKYPPGQVIKDIPTQKENSGHQNAGLANEVLEGRMFLEVPVQDKEVPKEILDYATSKDIYIRDENGKILNPHKKGLVKWISIISSFGIGVKQNSH